MTLPYTSQAQRVLLQAEQYVETRGGDCVTIADIRDAIEQYKTEDEVRKQLANIRALANEILSTYQ